MTALVIAEHDNASIKGATLNTVTAAAQCGGDVHVLVAGHNAGAVDFATEAGYFGALGMDTIIMGPGDIDCAHQPDEYLRLDRVEPTIDQLARLIQRFCVEPQTASPH